MTNDSLQMITNRSNGFYFLFDSIIEANAQPDGSFCQEIYMEGRLVDMAKHASRIADETLLELLKSCNGFRQLVHSIGITVQCDEANQPSMPVIYENWGKTNKYETGTRMKTLCPTDGSEMIILLSDYDWSEEDDVPGKLSFEFSRAGALATVSVFFYFNEGYESPQHIENGPIDTKSPEYRDMISKSLLQLGNNTRLKNAINKARNGEDVTIAYIGGSITEGASARPIHNSCYAHQSYVNFKQRYGKDNGEHIHLIKAGVGGTPSELGMIRYERDVLKHGAAQPDIVIIEFAVNDAEDETEGVCYESLVLRALQEPNKPAVILLFSVFINDWNLQDRLSPVGKHYDLPMVSVKDALVEQFGMTRQEGLVITKQQYFYDIYHPTNIGHTIMADCLGYLIDKVDRSIHSEMDIDLNKLPIIGNDFVHISLLDRIHNTHIAQIYEGSFQATDTDLHSVGLDDQTIRTPQFPNNWMHTKETGSNSFILKLHCKSLLLIYKDTGSNQFGSADILVDGKLVKTVDPLLIKWTHCHPIIVFNEQEANDHTIEIHMSAGHEEKCFTILGFGVVQ
ncbi:MAG: SGNH/GDSL hydrolase family protein [Candidatus Pristimantibacillus lignocellulolyticus]|uniref:SGNH/GDSL hydrolase family protein n=1 Tax=Candidatus Pristimantibacillus lignocellulolyticus TaxID=2994561 RepID=A0A9J6ZAS2_9BACL|nr:MAG: SGNH/GDSL hydrolase family protein [Candidatus Pristimantibacillus lignocellulolyticus]